MRRNHALFALVIFALGAFALATLFSLAVPLAAQAEPQKTNSQRADAPAPSAMPQPTLALSTPQEQQLSPFVDPELVAEYEGFSNFARNQVERMNATILGGRHSMQVRKGPDGLYRAIYKAIDLPGIVCQVRRSENDPQYYVGNLIYTEQLLESVAKTAEACRKGQFIPVSAKANRLIYTSKRGGGWN